VKVTTTNLQNSFGKFLEYVNEGEEIVITKNNKSIAKLVSFTDDNSVVEESTNQYNIDKHISYEAYLELVSKSDFRYELIDGEIFLQAIPLYNHQYVLKEIFGRFFNYFKNNKCQSLVAPFDVTLKIDEKKEPSVVQPDILVICDQETEINDGHYTGIPTLVVEILSKATRSKDMIKKLNLYSKSEIEEYWIVDTESKQIIIYEFKDKEIDKFNIYHENEIIKSNKFSGLEIDISQIFN
jgi:prevent-host-death family protein